MSTDRFDAEGGDVEIVPSDGVPRCSLKHAQEARRNYCGTVRRPREADELGALSVVEPNFSGGARLAFFRIGDSTVCEVRRLPPALAASESQPERPRISAAATRRRRASVADAGPLFRGHK